MSQEETDVDKLKEALLFRPADLKILQADKSSPYACEKDWTEILGEDENEIYDQLTEANFDAPSSIQGALIPIATRAPYPHVLAQAQNGSGKTLAFIVTSLLRINTAFNRVQVIILLPNQELAFQAAEYYTKLRIPSLKYSIITNTRDIEFNQLGQVVLATPGSLFSVFQYIPKISELDVFIIDECDEVVENTSYHEDLLRFSDKVCKAQFLLFSATLKDALKDYMNKYLPKAVQITLPLAKVMNTTNQHFIVYVKDIEEKVECIRLMFPFLLECQSFIFYNTKVGVKRIQEQLKSLGFDSEFISGEKPKDERQKIIEQFRKEEIRVLNTTDLLARGLDIPSAKAVINFELPMKDRKPDIATYLHRQGRCGRFGKNGKIINFVMTTPDKDLIKILENDYCAKFYILDKENFKYLNQKSK